MKHSPQIDAYWASFLLKSGRDPSTPLYDVFHFDDNETDADALVELVLHGQKRGTAGLLWEYEGGDKREPRAGDLSVVTDWSGSPRCVIETLRVDVCAFDEVSEEFVVAEGEGDRSVKYWRDTHWAYFGRVCKLIGHDRTLKMPVICEWFDVIFTADQEPEQPASR